MSPRTCLVLFASNHGQTERIATRIAERLCDAETDVTLADVTASPPAAAGYDLVVAGGSIHVGRHQRPLLAWLSNNADALSRSTCALFSVSLAAADPDPESREAVQGYLDDLQRRTGVHAQIATTFGGALAYPRYNPMIRWIMRRIAKRQGLPTDPEQTTELTDWAAVERFADELRALLSVPAAVR